MELCNAGIVTADTALHLVDIYGYKILRLKLVLMGCFFKLLLRIRPSAKTEMIACNQNPASAVVADFKPTQLSSVAVFLRTHIAVPECFDIEGIDADS